VVLFLYHYREVPALIIPRHSVRAMICTDVISGTVDFFYRFNMQILSFPRARHIEVVNINSRCVNVKVIITLVKLWITLK
jgi:hypothetical protein